MKAMAMEAKTILQQTYSYEGPDVRKRLDLEVVIAYKQYPQHPGSLMVPKIVTHGFPKLQSIPGTAIGGSCLQSA